MPSPTYRPDEDWVYASNCEPEAGITAGQLRDIADELDRLNGKVTVVAQSEAAEDDGTYSLKGLSRNQLLEITQIIGTSTTGATGSDSTEPLMRCIRALGYGGSIEELDACKAECDAAFPVSA